MNRYRGGGPSKATSSTTCQKCLKKGHYSYECTASKQDRPYISRPSRTQQLLNPKLAPKLTNDAPKDPLSKLTASEIIKKDAAATNRKRGRDDDSRDRPSKLSRSVSSSSSFNSISSISTNRSHPRSRSPPRRRNSPSRIQRRADSPRRRPRSPSPRRSSKPPDNARIKHEPEDSPVYRRRSRSPRRDTRRRSPSRSLSRSPSPSREARPRARSRDSCWRSPYRAPPRAEYQRRPRDVSRRDEPPPRGGNDPPIKRERSLSPFSKRKAMSMASR